MKRYAFITIAVILSLSLTASATACQKAAAPHPEDTQVSSSDSPASFESPVRSSKPILTDYVEIERITVVIENDEVERDAILSPVVVIFPEDATDDYYTLTSSDEDVVRRKNGQWTAVGGGSAEIIATALNGVAGRVTVTVVVPVETVSLGSSEIMLNNGGWITLTPAITPSDATYQRIRYTSSNRNVATVSESGMVKAVGTGTAEIKCSVDGISDTCTITVIVPVSSVTVSTDRSVYSVGEKGTITVEFNPKDVANRNYTVSISGKAIALKGENTFSCNASGDATITITAQNGVTGRITITVVDLVAFADEVFRLTNIEREKEGLTPFTNDAALTKTAVVRANEIIQNFSHDRPDGRSCFTAFDENNVTYGWAGENLAMGQKSPAEVLQNWMESSAHKENIFKREFKRLGVGVAIDSDGKLYWVQNFTD